MFAAASGARLAHRHNKAVKKQSSETRHLEGFPVHCKGFQKQQQLKYLESHGHRYAGIPHKRPQYSSKLYATNYGSNLKLSSSYVEINGRIPKFGHVDFEAAVLIREKQELRKKKLKIRRRRYELPSHVATKEIAPFPQFPPSFWGKAAWQDRDLSHHELERRESINVPNEAVTSHRTKQREAHRRWVRRNRIHDLSFGDCSSDDDELLYGVQNGAANLLLYVGLGTMCVGMIIAFVGTGEKGFKTMELRLIGPSLICAGVLLIILRIMLCVCPSKCLKLKNHKQKLKNSTNKLNSEGSKASQDVSSSKEAVDEESKKQTTACNDKKRVSIAMLPTTSGLSTNSSDNLKSKTTTYPETSGSLPVPTISFLEFEKPCSSKSSSRKIPNLISSDEDEADGAFELKQMDGSNLDVTSLESQSSLTMKFSNVSETLVSPDNSDVSITSLVNVSHEVKSIKIIEDEKTNASKFEMSRNPKNLAPKELVLNPSNLSETKEKD